MKRIFTTLFMVMGICTFTYAQKTAGETEFSIGGGYNSSTALLSNSNANAGYRSGFNIGVGVDVYFSESWSIKMKAIYDKKGWQNGFLNTPTINFNNVPYNTAYLTIPVTANWHFGKQRNWYLNAGPYVGFLTNADVNGITDVNGVSVKSGILNGTDGGIALGIGLKIPVTATTKFYIEFDGQAGLAEILKRNATVSGTGNARNSRSSFNIGLSF